MVADGNRLQSEKILHGRGVHPIMVRLNDDQSKEFEKWRKKFNQPKGTFAALCIQAGLKSVIRGVSPESAVDDDTMKKMLAMIMQNPAFKKLLSLPKAKAKK